VEEKEEYNHKWTTHTPSSSFLCVCWIGQHYFGIGCLSENVFFEIQGGPNKKENQIPMKTCLFEFFFTFLNDFFRQLIR
jgi:hypothetical protein